MSEIRYSVIIAGVLLGVIGGLAVSPAVGLQITGLHWLAVTILTVIITGALFLKDDLTLLLAILAAFLIFSIGFWAPALQPLIYLLAFKHPAIIQWVFVGLLVVATSIVLHETTDMELTPKVMFGLGIGIIVVMGIIIGPLAGAIYSHTHISDDVMDDVEMVDNFSATDADNIRIMPQNVGAEVSENRMQYPRHKMGVEDIVFLNGTPHWSFGLEPDGLINTLVHNQAGAIYANMTTRSADVHTLEDEFRYGVGQRVTDNYIWQLRHDRYFIEHQDPFVVPHEGDLHIAVPQIEYEHQWKWKPLPQVYSVPTFGGVHLMDADGNIEDLSPEEAQEHPVLEGENFYPYDLTHYEVESTQYRNGVMNKWFYHEEQIQFPNLPSDNSQPFTIKTEDGIKYVAAVEPWGDSSGILEVWMVDARTGKMSMKQWNPDDTQVGPEKAMDYVRQEKPLWDWTQLSPAEPIPVFIDGQLHWNVRVITDAPLVRASGFVNADTGDVTMIREDADVRAFVKGEDVSDIEEPPINETDGGFTIVITDENGEVVEEITISDGWNIEFEEEDDA